MQAVGRRYVRYFNDRHGRSGTLWEGRYKSTLIQTDRYLLACMVYIDLNPVRAGMVAEARDYPWSSHAHYAGLRHDKLLTPHPLYWSWATPRSPAKPPTPNLVRAGVSGRRSGRADRGHAAWLGGGRSRLLGIVAKSDAASRAEGQARASAASLRI